MARKQKTDVPTFIDALEWLLQAATDSHRAIGIRTGGDSEFVVKYFENGIAQREVAISGVHAFRRALKTLEESLDVAK